MRAWSVYYTSKRYKIQSAINICVFREWIEGLGSGAAGSASVVWDVVLDDESGGNLLVD